MTGRSCWVLGLALLLLGSGCDRFLNRKDRDDDEESSERSEESKEESKRSRDTSKPTAEPTEGQALFAVGAKVSVEWQGSWYPASVLETQGARYKIHYTGWGAEWDEWVGPERIRAATGAEQVVPRPTSTRTTTKTAACYDCAAGSPPAGQECCAPELCQGDAQCTGGKVCCLAPGGHVAQCRGACTGGWTRFGASSTKPPMVRVR